MIKKDRFLLKSFLAAVLFTSAAFCVYSEVSFENPDLNGANQLLFNVKHQVSGANSYSTVFMSDVSLSSGTKVLTCYPEKMELLSKGAILQIRNRYGTARYSAADKTLSWVNRADSVPYESIRQVPQAVSPDGKWICFVKRQDNQSGQLILKNSSTLQETILDRNSDFSFEKVPVLWSPDSGTLLYEKNGAVYFCEPKAAFGKVLMTEEFRKIGDGTINSVCWATPKLIIYIDRDLIYRVSANELYTRGLYSQMVGNGVVTGRLPVPFNADHDRFFVNQYADTIVVIQQNNIVTSYKMASSGFEYVAAINSKPLAEFNSTITGTRLYWASDGNALLWVDQLSMEDAKRISTVHMISSGFKTLAYFENCGEPAVSPDGKSIAFSQEDGIYVYDINSWRLRAKSTGEKIVSYVWNSKNSLYVGGDLTVKKWNFVAEDGEAPSAKVIFMSSAEKAWWKNENSVSAVNKNKDIFDYDMTAGTWNKRSVLDSVLAEIPESKLQNGKFRVFAGDTPNLKFKNTIYVRTLSGKAVTKALFPETSVKAPAPKKIALAIDALDDASGLSYILSVLNKYEVNATFFINGEFLRRYPKETKQIVKCGYECSSMFFTNADLTSKEFVLNEDFVRRGLARNEDEFYQTTGKELGLLWHAPYYKANEKIKAAGKESGYSYVECGRFSLDTMTLERAARGEPGYLTACQMISFYLENSTDKTIIPVSAGLSKGSRSDYLYEKLDLLIGSLLNQGYEIVPVREL